ncbi:hypothetical protein VNO77_37186 [Canavalia gladiata]|uniref:Uncharacterized protein n=1 Tax=Canavalia gladiata TaxID=3824 RepID=A0AAN9KAU7_CANGL
MQNSRAFAYNRCSEGDGGWVVAEPHFQASLSHVLAIDATTPHSTHTRVATIDHYAFFNLTSFKAPTHTTRERFALFPLSGPLNRPLRPITFQLNSQQQMHFLQLATATLFAIL